LNHAVDTCHQFEAKSLKDKVETLVHERAYRPALKTTKSWQDYLREYMSEEGAEAPQGFPWSAKFAKAKAKENKGYAIHDRQKAWDAGREIKDLLEDPDHQSLEQVGDLYWLN
jgi:hypothetical protein